MKTAGAFKGLPREVRWNIGGYLAGPKSFSMIAKLKDDLLLSQLSHEFLTSRRKV
jgi:hypothetical protein